jgi:BMFP domain-containing protein YqiC
MSKHIETMIRKLINEVNLTIEKDIVNTLRDLLTKKNIVDEDINTLLDSFSKSRTTSPSTLTRVARKKKSSNSRKIVNKDDTKVSLTCQYLFRNGAKTNTECGSTNQVSFHEEAGINRCKAHFNRIVKKRVSKTKVIAINNKLGGELAKVHEKAKDSGTDVLVDDYVKQKRERVNKNVVSREEVDNILNVIKKDNAKNKPLEIKIVESVTNQ